MARVPYRSRRAHRRRYLAGTSRGQPDPEFLLCCPSPPPSGATSPDTGRGVLLMPLPIGRGGHLEQRAQLRDELVEVDVELEHRGGMAGGGAGVINAELSADG